LLGVVIRANGRVIAPTESSLVRKLVQFAGRSGSRQPVRDRTRWEFDRSAGTNVWPSRLERVMSTRGDDHLESGTDRPLNARRFQTSVWTLVVLVACCGVVLWAARRLWENYDPVRVEARSIQNRAIAALRSGKSAERVDAVHELQRLTWADRAVAIGSLIGALEDPGTEVRVAAAEALGSIGPIAMRSQSGQESARNAATSLVRCLKDPQPGVRTAAATSLGSILWPRGPVALKSAIDRQAVMDALASVLSDRDARVRLTAIEALVSRDSGTGPPEALLSVLDDESAENRATAIRSLWFYGQGLNPWVPALLRVASKDPDPSVQGEIFSLWNNKRLRPPAVTAEVVPCLIASLQSGDRKVRRLAAELLPEFRAAANVAIPELLRVLNEPLQPGVATTSGESGNPNPAIHAAFALGSIGPGSAKAKHVIAALVEVARNGPRSRRAWAASALGGFGTDAAEAAPVLTQLIEQTVPDEDWRPVLLARALAKITAETPSARQTIGALVGLLESNEMRVRVPVLRALGEFGPSAAVAIPRIRALKNDPALPVREAAVAALARIENQSAP
jgi:HEAT repeat protein